MAGGKLGGEDDAMTEVNILPLVDVILVVLIIFMVTTSYIVSPSIKVNLPDAATGDATPPSSLAITVAADGRLGLDGQPVDEASLRAAVRAARAASKDVVCLIEGDDEARHGDVTHVIDLVKQEGVAKFAINVDPAALPLAATGATQP